MADSLRSLSEASGYLELGMLAEARAALNRVPAAERHRPEVIHFRIGLHVAEKQWAEGRELALHLVNVQPEDAESWIRLAYCTRRAASVADAEEILMKALSLHPEEAMVRYNLACYACVTGRMEEARERLREAFTLHEGIRKLAAEDEDLKPLWRELRELN